MMNAFTCGILAGLILDELYEQWRLGKVCRSYWFIGISVKSQIGATLKSNNYYHTVQTLTTQ